MPLDCRYSASTALQGGKGGKGREEVWQGASEPMLAHVPGRKRRGMKRGRVGEGEG